MGEGDDETLEDPTPPDTRVAQLPDDPEDEVFPPPEQKVEVSPPVDVVTIDHAEAGLEPPQVDDEDGGQPENAPEPLPADQRTLRVHGLFRLPDLTAATTVVTRTKRQATRTLTAVYHDTDDLRLARWGATLLRREGGRTRVGTSVCRSTAWTVSPSRCACRCPREPPARCPVSSPTWCSRSHAAGR